jgi:phage FluMu protein gp41
MPLQLFFADLHSEVPLQELTPSHFTVAASAANAVVLMTEVNSMAAAAAMATLDSLLLCIF